MKKKLILFCMSVFAAICCLCAFAACDIIILDDDDWEQCTGQHLQFQLLEDGTYSVVGLSVNCVDESIAIPSEYNGKSVTQIKQRAFEYEKAIRKIVIPDSVTAIGALAFYGCRNLETIEIGNQVKSIGGDAFVSTAFFENATWESDEAIYLGNYLILVNPNLEGEYIVKEGTTVIAGGAFYDCSLREVTLPESVTEIPADAFARSESLERVKMGKHVQTIGSRAFMLCSSLAEIELPESIETIGVGAFAGCKSLKSIVLGENVISIERGAFSQCRSLEVIELGRNIAFLGRGLFYQCDNLQTIIYHGTMEEWNAIEIDVFLWSYGQDTVIQCTDGTITQEG